MKGHSKGYENKIATEYYITVDTAKELCMIENNPSNIFDFMRLALIAIIKDISKSEYWQVYFKPQGVKCIINWLNENKEKIYYKIR